MVSNKCVSAYTNCFH